jgi:tetratricopeptide (TPR) repeat protein
VALFRETDDTFGLAVALSALGTAHRAREEFAEAHIALEESARIARETNDDWLLALPLQYLGLVTFKQGEYEKSEAYLKESLLPSIRRSGDEWFGASLLEVLATLAAYRGDPTRAARLYGAAEAMREEIGTTVLPYEVIEHERGTMSARKALGEEGFTVALAEGKAMTPEQRIAEALV